MERLAKMLEQQVPYLRRAKVGWSGRRILFAPIGKRPGRNEKMFAKQTTSSKVAGIMNLNEQAKRNISTSAETTILIAYNEFIMREYSEEPHAEFSEILEHDGRISIAYTEFEEGEKPYLSIQVSYDPDTEEYVYEYIYTDTENLRMSRTFFESASHQQFIEDLKFNDFDDFVGVEPEDFE